MLILEVDFGMDPETAKLLGLVEFLAGRAQDTATKKHISQIAFINMARQLGINVTASNLGDMISRPPLSNVLEPLNPASGVVVFKGGESTDVKMPVDKARDIVSRMAKRASKKGD
jgi:hypothetical protein